MHPYRKVRPSSLLLLIFSFCIMMLMVPFFYGCSGLQLGQPDEPEIVKQKKAYAAARKEFALTLQKYNQYYDRASPEQQAEWKENIDPWFKKVDTALDAWKLAIDNNWDPAAQEQKYLDMKSDLLLLLVDVFGVKEE